LVVSELASLMKDKNKAIEKLEKSMEKQQECKCKKNDVNSETLHLESQSKHTYPTCRIVD